MKRPIFRASLPPALRTPPTPSGGGLLWRGIVGIILAIFAGLLIADIVQRPTKRNVELLAGVIFMGMAIIADPDRVLAFAILLLPYPMHTSVGSTSTLLVLGVGALVMMKKRTYGLQSPFVDRSVDLSIMGVALMMVISLGQMESEHLGSAIEMLVGFAAALTLYFLTVQIVRSRKTFEFILKTAMVSATTVGLIGTLQTLFPQRSWLPAFFKFSQRMEGYEGSLIDKARVYASFPGISPFAEYVGIAIILQYILFRRSRSLNERIFWLGSILLLLIALAGSATRMGVIILLFGFSYMILMAGRAIPRAQLLSVAFVCFAIFLLSYSFIQPLTEQMEERLSELGTEDGSSQSRWGVMVQAFRAVPDSPLLGHGLFIPVGTFRGGVSKNIHNLYLTLAYTIGIPGLIAFCWLLVSIYRRSLAIVNDLRVPPDIREYMLGLHVALTMFMVYQLTSDYVTHVMAMHFVWLRLGITMALIKVAVRLRDEEAGAEGPVGMEFVSRPVG